MNQILKARRLIIAAATTLTFKVPFINAENVYSHYNIDISFDPDDDTNAIFKVQLANDSWVGLALGDSGMTPGTDLIQIDGANQLVYDKVSSGYQYPTTDGTGHLTATFTDVGNNWFEVLIKRPLDTGDSQDYVLPTGT